MLRLKYVVLSACIKEEEKTESMIQASSLRIEKEGGGRRKREQIKSTMRKEIIL